MTRVVYSIRPCPGVPVSPTLTVSCHCCQTFQCFASMVTGSHQRELHCPVSGIWLTAKDKTSCQHHCSSLTKLSSRTSRVMLSLAVIHLMDMTVRDSLFRTVLRGRARVTLGVKFATTTATSDHFPATRTRRSSPQCTRCGSPHAEYSSSLHPRFMNRRHLPYNFARLT